MYLIMHPDFIKFLCAKCYDSVVFLGMVSVPLLVYMNFENEKKIKRLKRRVNKLADENIHFNRQLQTFNEAIEQMKQSSFIDEEENKKEDKEEENKDAQYSIEDANYEF